MNKKNEKQYFGIAVLLLIALIGVVINRMTDRSVRGVSAIAPSVNLMTFSVDDGLTDDQMPWVYDPAALNRDEFVSVDPLVELDNELTRLARQLAFEQATRAFDEVAEEEGDDIASADEIEDAVAEPKPATANTNSDPFREPKARPASLVFAARDTTPTPATPKAHKPQATKEMEDIEILAAPKVEPTPEIADYHPERNTLFDDLDFKQVRVREPKQKARTKCIVPWAGRYDYTFITPPGKTCDEMLRPANAEYRARSGLKSRLQRPSDALATK